MACLIGLDTALSKTKNINKRPFVGSLLIDLFKC